MSLFKRSAGKGDSLNPILYLIVAPFILLIEGAKWCTDKVYSGFAGAFRALFGFVFATGGAVAASHYVGWDLGYGWYAWLPAGIAAWFGVLFYAWPLLYRYIVGPAIELCEAIYDRVRTYTKQYAGPVANGIVKAISTVCVGSGPAWNRVLTKEHEDTWFAKLVGVVAHLSAFASTAYLGWQAYTAVGALVGFPVVGFVLAVLAGILTFGILFGLVEQLMQYGKLAFVALALGVGVVWGAAPYVVALTGLSGLLVYAAWAVAYVAFVGYVFPFVNVLFTLGLLEKLWKFLKPLPEKTYDDRDDKYSEFFHHVVNIGVTGTVTYFAYGVCAALVPFTGAVALTALVAAVTYIVAYKFIGHGGGNYIVGGLTSLGAAYCAGTSYVAAGYVYGVYGGITAGVLALLATGVIGFPLVYVGLRLVLRGIGISKLGGPLASLYFWANEQFKSGLKQIRHAYTNCYRDKSGYNELVVHVVNIAAAVAVFYGAMLGVAALGTGAIVGWVAVGLATFLSYTLVGKVLSKSGYGLEFLGGVAGLASAVYVGTQVYAVDPSTLYQVAGIAAGFATWFAVFCIVFPVAYVVARFLTSWALTGWLKPLLQWVYDIAWSVFTAVWTQLVRAYNGLITLLTPLWLRLCAAGARVRDAYRDLLSRIRGRS